MLAIAGLIFLMVFIALPALQRNQRDTQRRQDYAQLASQIQGYMTNNNGNLPAAGTDLPENRYLNSTGETPNGAAYVISIVNAVPAAPNNETQVYVVLGGQNCTGGAPADAGGGAKNFAIYGYLESGSNYCQAY